MEYNKIALGFLGLASGTLSICLLLRWGTVFDVLEGPFTPGLIFGVVLACYFAVVRARNLTYLYRLPVFIAMSWFGYYMAVQIAINKLPLGLELGGLDGNNVPFPSSMFIAGCVGAFILGLGFLAIHRWHWSEIGYFVVLSVLGGILGLTFFLGKPLSQSFPSLVSALIGFKTGDDPALLILFVVWQTGIAFYLGYLLDRVKEV